LVRVSPNGKAEPLHTVFDLPDRVEILIDLPLADEKSLTVSLYQKTLKVRAKLREKILIGGYEVEEYVKIMKIPEDVDEEYELEIVNREGPIVVIVFPKAARP